jgi:hypothetical protein
MRNKNHCHACAILYGLLVGIRMHGLHVQQGATLVQLQILPEGLGEGRLKQPQERRDLHNVSFGV